MIEVYRWSDTGVESLGSHYSGGVPTEVDTWLWVDVVGEAAERVEDVGRVFGIDPATVHEAVATTNLPLLEEHLGSSFVVIHAFTTGEGEGLSTHEIDTFVGPRFLITIRDGRGTTVDVARERLTREGDLPVSSPAGLLAFLGLMSGRHYQPLIQELERQVDALEEKAIQGDPQTVVDVHALRRDVIYLRRVLAPQYEVYEDLMESTHPAIDDKARMMFRRVTNHHRRALESIETGRALLSSVLETYRGALADQTNEIMRVLTVFSAILLPLTLIAGLWGMNFDGIPGAGVNNGFWILTGAMALLAIGVWVYFARRGFIGAPRLRDLPKAVGLGLFSIGTAPIRAVRQRGRSDGEKR
ncbi:MAG TPA: magnesium transporter CorA family protein [Acidimicrobiia bacterium]|nr:magnesium transporter CorA family protein [Acidimicrobiia bacterium]